MLLRLITVSGLAFVAVADRYSERYVFYIQEPQLCPEDGPCTDEQYEQCGAGRQCGIYNGKSACGTWAGNKNYCCSYSHAASNDHNCYEDEVKDFVAKFTSFTTSGDAATEDSNCPTGEAFISFGIKDKSNDLCCPLEQDAFVLLKNTTTMVSTGREFAARCVDALIPSSASPSPSPSGDDDDEESETPTETDSEMSTPTKDSSMTTSPAASTTPNAASSNFVSLAGLVPIALLMLAGL